MATARLKPGRCNSWCYYAPVNGLPGKVCFYCGLPPEDAVSETEAEPGPSAPPALKLYDVHVDEFRAVTQADVDQLCEVARAYGALKTAVEQVHAEHRKNIAEIRSKHGMPA